MDSEDRSTQKDTSSSAVTSSLSDLIARLEKATVPDRELDRDIWRIACGKASFRDYAPLYTESIDAAMTLIETGHGMNLQGNGDVWYAVVFGKRSKACKSPALAIAAAALKARSLPAI